MILSRWSKRPILATMNLGFHQSLPSSPFPFSMIRTIAPPDLDRQQKSDNAAERIDVPTPTVHDRKAMSLERQVRIVMGCLILVSSLLAFYSIYWIALVAFFGAGLIFSGAANFCGWSPILARMPWNRSDHSVSGSPQSHNSFSVPSE
jgi:hypothetical protein